MSKYTGAGRAEFVQRARKQPRGGQRNCLEGADGVSETMVDLIFCYGSLLRAFARTRSLRVERDLAFVGAGSVEGALYEVGIYPALVPDPDGEVVGEVHQMSHPGRVLEVLDEYEGCSLETPETSLYLRKVIRVALADGETVEAWAYFYNGPTGQAHRIDSGDYLKYTGAAGPQAEQAAQTGQAGRARRSSAS